MTSTNRILAAAVLAGCALSAAACESRPVPLPTTPSASTPAASSPPVPAGWTSGTFTWDSIEAPSRTICAELSGQVGQSWPLYVRLEQDGNPLILLMNEDAPPDPNDPIDYAPLKWVGGRAGDTIAASLQGGYGGMACPSDASVTPETGGELEATLSANQISGKYTEVYGTGANAVTFRFHFVAQAPVAPQRR